MPKTFSHERPKKLKSTLIHLFFYFKKHIFMLLIITVLVIVSASANVYGTYLVKPIINNYILPHDMKGLLKMIFFISAIYLIGASCTYFYSQFMVKVAQSMIEEMRDDLFSHIQKLPLKFFDSSTHGETMSRFTNDIDTISTALNSAFTVLLQSLVMLLGTFIALFILNWMLSVIVLATFILMFLFLKFSSSQSRKYFTSQQKYLGELNSFVEETVQGQKVVKVFNHEKENCLEFERRNENLRLAATNAMTYSGIMMPVVVSISYLNYALAACIGAAFAISGIINIGALASYLIYVRQAAQPVNQFSQQINFILAAMSGAERIFEVMDYEPEIDDGKITIKSVAQKTDGSLEISKKNTGFWAWEKTDRTLTLLKGDVILKDVYFGYSKDRLILKNINLYAKPGEKVAFVGSTGAGKTTITNLINRFYDINSGSITYDGIDIKDIKKSDLRISLSIVLQDTHLFTGTIAENISYAKQNATEEEIINAAKLANADSFIRRLPDGYNTIITGDGSGLSQGQQQLLSIARAAILNTPVLILDEATSSVDTRTEKLIQIGMDRLMEGRTVFVIAHRLSTVRNAKVIIVLENGEIVERGSHEELIEKKGIYYNLCTGKSELK